MASVHELSEERACTDVKGTVQWAVNCLYLMYYYSMYVL